eukprot:6213208-Pleurochrysis_carterae.AAC.2
MIIQCTQKEVQKSLQQFLKSVYNESNGKQPPTQQRRGEGPTQRSEEPFGYGMLMRFCSAQCCAAACVQSTRTRVSAVRDASVASNAAFRETTEPVSGRHGDVRQRRVGGAFMRSAAAEP